MTLKLFRWILPCACILMPFSSHAREFPTPTVEDAVRMTRIQYSVSPDGSLAAISPDGKKAAVVTWRGDIERNLNVYTLRILDLVELGLHRPRDILSLDFAGDPEDQTASPFSQLVFLTDNRTLAFLGRQGEAPAQVYAVDTETKQMRRLTQHPTAVRSFVMGPNGELRAFSAVAPASAGQQKSRLEEDGVFMWDFELFPSRFDFYSAFPVLWNKGEREIRQYFLAASESSRPFFDSRLSRPAAPLDMRDPNVANSPKFSLEDEAALSGWATLTGDPAGRSLLLFPYGLTDHPINLDRYAYYAGPGMNAYARRVAAPLGLVDVATGRIERLIDAPSPQFERESGRPLWAEDGRSVIVYTLMPQAPSAPPQWVEVDLATRRITPLELPKQWKPIAWADDGTTLVLRGNDGRFGNLHREPGKGWGKLTETGTAERFNHAWNVATNGRIVIGVKDASSVPPELVAYDLASGRSTVLSDFNPSLHQRRYGAVEWMEWPGQYQKDATGYLIKPVGYQPGRRYPLVILLDDNTMRREDEPYLLDAVWQLSGHAIQMLAAQGFMVLYPHTPPLREVVQTSAEGERMRDNIESAIAHLDRAGLIDPAHVGLSGWSRAAYYTDYVLIHSPIAFAAATTIDGGASEYNESMRPFTDEELKRIRTPKLFEPHGVASLVGMGAMADRMRALGKPADILYFHTASHSTTRPQHRMRSLVTHIDWWRFWLKGEQDQDPAKAAEYAHWREMRYMQNAGE